MLFVKNIFLKSILWAVFLFPMAVFAADKTVDCAGRPRWDRYVVDEKSVKWDPSSAKCFGESDGSKIYGGPKMYGEYDSSDKPDYSNLYGTPTTVKSHNLYGKYENTVNPAKRLPTQQMVASNKKYLPPPKINNEKISVPKKAKEQKTVVKIEPVTVVSEPVAEKSEPIVIPPKPKPVIPDVNAKSIAVSNEKIDADYFCKSINPPVTGELPKGLVLMPGRPDLMSCVKK